MEEEHLGEVIELHPLLSLVLQNTQVPPSQSGVEDKSLQSVSEEQAMHVFVDNEHFEDVALKQWEFSVHGTQILSPEPEVVQIGLGDVQPVLSDTLQV